MKLYLENNNQCKLLAEVETEHEANEKIRDFLSEYKPKHPYVRTWIAGNKKWIDFGSWSEFIILDMEG